MTFASLQPFESFASSLQSWRPLLRDDDPSRPYASSLHHHTPSDLRPPVP